MEKVFVTNAQLRTSLAVIRSLGRKGIHVTAGDERRIAMSFFSKYCKQKVVYPDPHNYGKLKIFMNSFLKKRKFDLVFPVWEDMTMFFSKHKDEFSRYAKVPVIEYDKYIRARDKQLTMEAAEKAGVPYPKSYFINNISELERISRKIEYPVIIKPTMQSGSHGLTYCSTAQELVVNFKKVVGVHGKSIIQEYIPYGGDAIGVSCLYDYDSKPVAVFSHKRLREYPIGGGPSTLRMAIKHREAERLAVKLLNELNWFGLAMVEFKTDPRDGSLKLMEINPRVWGSVALPICSGVDFPYLLYRLAMDGKVKKVTSYKVGTKCRWYLGDVLHFLNSPDKLKSIPNLFNLRQKNTHYDVLSRSDPGPFFGRLLSIAAYAFDSKARKQVVRSGLPAVRKS
ncbi:MAG: ATP-grasp domain-containing protein [Nanoarchaeota archaeon]